MCTIYFFLQMLAANQQAQKLALSQQAQQQQQQQHAALYMQQQQALYMQQLQGYYPAQAAIPAASPFQQGQNVLVMVRLYNYLLYQFYIQYICVYVSRINGHLVNWRPSDSSKLYQETGPSL